MGRRSPAVLGNFSLGPVAAELEVADAQEDLAGLSGMPTPAPQDVGKRHAAVEDGPDVPAFDKDHRRPQAGVITDDRFREPVETRTTTADKNPCHPAQARLSLICDQR